MPIGQTAMTSKKRIKLPGGRLVTKRPDKLRLLLSENRSLIEAPVYDTGRSAAGSQNQAGSEQRTYDNEAFDIERLVGFEVTILGAGSVGSYLAYFLAAASLILNIIDFKKVEYRHTTGGRTVYKAATAGLYKVNALKQIIEGDRLGATVNPLPYNVAEINDTELKALFARSALVVIAIDDPAQLLRAADLAYPMVEYIQVALQSGAKSGYIAVSAPFATPCLRCTLDIDSHDDIQRLDSEPANSFDIVTVAQLAAKVAVDIIYSKATGQNITRWDTSKNLIYVANTRQQLSPEGPGIIMEGSSKRHNCPTCSNHTLQKGGVK